MKYAAAKHNPIYFLLSSMNSRLKEILINFDPKMDQFVAVGKIIDNYISTILKITNTFT